jgi:hypothetical protein
MPKIPFTTKVFHSRIPPTVLDRAKGLDSSGIINRINRHKLDLTKLSARTGVDRQVIWKLVIGDLSPLNTRGEWTGTAVKLAAVLLTEPEVLFAKTFDRVHSSLVMPEEEGLRETVIGEFYPKR